MAEDVQTFDELDPEGLYKEWNPEERPWSFDGKPVLLINHMQNAVIGTTGHSGAPDSEVAKDIAENKIIEKQRELLAAFRKNDLPIAYVNVIMGEARYPKWGRLFEISRRVEYPKGGLTNPDVRHLPDVVPELGRLESEPVFYQKVGVDPGWGLREWLNDQGTTEIVLTGYTTHSTVYASLLALTGAGFSCVLPADSSSSPTVSRKARDIVREEMAPMVALVTSVKDVIAHLPE